MITMMTWWRLQWWRWGWGVLRPRSGRIYAATGLPLPMPALPHHVMFRHNHRHSHRHQTCRHSHNCKLSLHFFIILLTLSYIIASYQLDTSSYCTDVSYLQCKWKLISETSNFPPLSKAERLHYHPKNYRLCTSKHYYHHNVKHDRCMQSWKSRSLNAGTIFAPSCSFRHFPPWTHLRRIWLLPRTCSRPSCPQSPKQDVAFHAIDDLSFYCRWWLLSRRCKKLVHSLRVCPLSNDRGLIFLIAKLLTNLSRSL